MSVKKQQLINCLATTYPKLVEEWHSTLNEKTAYDFTVGSEAKVWWQCPKFEDHFYQARICNRTRIRSIDKSGCPFCTGRKVTLSNCLATTHPELVEEWHSTLNEKTAYDFIAGGKAKVWWQCLKFEDHIYQAQIRNRTRTKPTGCPFCTGRKVTLSNCLATTHPELVEEWHPTLNEKTAYDFTAGRREKVWWQCLKFEDHIYQAQIRHRTKTKPTGCPFCNDSLGERIITKYFKENNIEFKKQYQFKNSKKISRRFFDFAVSEGLIEYNGIQHYVPSSFGSKQKNADYIKFKETVRGDSEKEIWCEKNNLKLLKIPYWDLERIPEILNDFLQGKEPFFNSPPNIVLEYESIRNNMSKNFKIEFLSA